MDNLSQITIGSKASQIVDCSHCHRDVPAGQYFSFKGKKGEDIYLCDSCRDTVEKALKAETENPNVIMAVVFGALAALLGGFIWFWFVVLTHWQIGYLAIGVGFLVGHGVILGSGGKRGHLLQTMSAVLTLVALFFSEYFIILYETKIYLSSRGYTPGALFYISPLDHRILQSLVSPVGLLIWAIGLYFAYSIPKQRVL